MDGGVIDRSVHRHGNCSRVAVRPTPLLVVCDSRLACSEVYSVCVCLLRRKGLQTDVVGQLIIMPLLLKIRALRLNVMCLRQIKS